MSSCPCMCMSLITVDEIDLVYNDCPFWSAFEKTKNVIHENVISYKIFF